MVVYHSELYYYFFLRHYPYFCSLYAAVYYNTVLLQSPSVLLIPYVRHLQSFWNDWGDMSLELKNAQYIRMCLVSDLIYLVFLYERISLCTTVIFWYSLCEYFNGLLHSHKLLYLQWPRLILLWHYIAKGTFKHSYSSQTFRRICW